jgi:hypothetical protein
MRYWLQSSDRPSAEPVPRHRWAKAEWPGLLYINPSSTPAPSHDVKSFPGCGVISHIQGNDDAEQAKLYSPRSLTTDRGVKLSVY